MLPSTVHPLKTSCEPAFWLMVCEGIEIEAVLPALNQPLPCGDGAPEGCADNVSRYCGWNTAVTVLDDVMVIDPLVALPEYPPDQP